jgi:hypothetical protein
LAVPPVTAGLTASAIASPLIGALAVAMVVSGGLAASNASPADPAPVSTSIAQPYVSGERGRSNAAPAPTGTTRSTDDPGAAVDSATDTLAPVTGPLGSTVNDTVTGVGSTVDGLVTDLSNPVNSLIPGLAVGPGTLPVHTAPSGTAGVTSDLDLTGTGIPGATVSVQAAGVVYGMTGVTPQGTWAIHITALPSSVVGLQLKQTVLSRLGMNLDIPLTVLSNSLGVTLEVLGL